MLYLDTILICKGIDEKVLVSLLKTENEAEESRPATKPANYENTMQSHRKLWN